MEELSLVGGKPVGPHWVTRTRKVRGYPGGSYENLDRRGTDRGRCGRFQTGAGEARVWRVVGGGGDDTAHRAPLQGCPASGTSACHINTCLSG